ncbi:MAG: hypothetical protein JW846_11025 [Dehalococcoidia bacterium]|nr:hypothetical protein [Dehalococcoidia bacterium]
MWTLVLVEAETVDAHRVIKGHAPGDQTTVLCTVALPDYPLADTIVRDQEFTIRGTVDGIGAHAIELFDCELLFPM